MTTDTGTTELRMIDRQPGQPRKGRMTITAQIRRGRMTGNLADSDSPVMTIGTSTHDLQMIDLAYRQPAQRRMTTAADIGGIEMAIDLALRDQAVMTIGAHTDDLGMIDKAHRNPADHRMTGLTLIGRRNMSRWLTGSRHAMTGRAIIDDATVIEQDTDIGLTLNLLALRGWRQCQHRLHIERQPVILAMTQCTTVGRRQMSLGLAHGDQ